MGRSIFGGDHASVTEVSVLFFTTGSVGGWVGGFLGAAKEKNKTEQEVYMRVEKPLYLTGRAYSGVKVILA